MVIFFNQTLKNITLELPQTPELQDIKKLVLNRDKIIKEQIIKPKDKLIRQLYNKNVSLYKKLSKQIEMIDTAEDFVKEKANLQNKNKNLIIDYQLLQKEKQESKKNLNLNMKIKLVI